MKFQSASIATALFALLQFAVTAYTPAYADTPTPEVAQPARPRIALVLSGGGARGLAHIGVIRELERMRIPISCIVGTSMGGVVGGIYASGMPIHELEQSARNIDWAMAFQDRPDRSSMRAQRKRDEDGHFARPEFGYRDGQIITPAGVIYGQNLAEILNQFAQRASSVNDFDKLPIPYRAVATDIVTGQAVILDHGQLPQAMRATMSVPAVMAPIELDGKLLIDGGLVDNLPVVLARQLCGDVVIAVNLGTPLLERKDIGSAVSVGLQMVNILTEQNVRASLAALQPRDILISPKLDGLSAGSFDRVDDLIAAGVQAALASAGRLAHLQVPPLEFAEWKLHHDLPSVPESKPDEVRVAKLNWVNPGVLANDLKAPEDHQSTHQLALGSNRIFERGDFERVQLGFLDESGRRIAVLDAKEKSWGPDYLRFGLSMAAQTGESTSFNAVVGYTRTWINSFGARWQNILQVGAINAVHSEFYQPLSPGSAIFIAPRLLGTMDQAPIYLGEAQVARIGRTQGVFALEAGTEIGRSGEARLGMEIGQEAYKGEIGPITGSTAWSSIRSATARLDVDALDRAHFPTRGHKVVFGLVDASKAMGSEKDFKRRTLEASMVGTWGPNTWSTYLMAGKVDYSGAVRDIVFDLIPLGGFQRLSGYPTGRFRVEEVQMVRLGYQRNIPPFLGLNLGGIVNQNYFGGTVELANIQQSYDPQTQSGLYRSASLFVGADTILGPAALSFGLGKDGNKTLWLSIGIPWTLH